MTKPHSTSNNPNILDSAPDSDEVGLVVRVAGTVAVTGGSGGTEYIEDDASPANPTAPSLVVVRRDTPATITTTDGDWTTVGCTAKGELYVKHLDAIPVTDNGGSLTVDGSVSATQGTSPWVIGDGGGSISVDDGGGSLTIDGSVSITGTPIVDTELPAAAALSNAFANPTAPAVGAFLMGFSGSDWSRLYYDIVSPAVSVPALAVRPVTSDRQVTTTFTANGQTLTVDLDQGQLGIAVDLRGTFSAGTSILCEGSFDGTNYFTARHCDQIGNDSRISAMVGGAALTRVIIPPPGCKTARLRVTAFAGGDSVIAILRASNGNPDYNLSSARIQTTDFIAGQTSLITRAVPPYPLVKGTNDVSLYGYQVQETRDLDRTHKLIFGHAIAAVNAEAAVNWQVISGLAGAAGAASSYTVTSGQILRLGSCRVLGQFSAAATSPTAFTLRVRITTAITGNLWLEIPVRIAAVGAVEQEVNLVFPEGMEVVGGTVLRFSHLSNSATGTQPTYDVEFYGYEY